jgi:hypothetical protein
MKNITKRLIRDEKGAALILALILLLVGGLITAALLGHMGAGLLAGEVYGRRTIEVYAADAGVEDAMWKIQHKVPEVENLTQCSDKWTYNITDADGGVAEVNDKRVEVTITLMTIWDDLPLDYRIESTAIGDGSETKVDAYVAGKITYCSMLDHLITIQEDLDDKGVEALENDLRKLEISCPEECEELEQCDKCGKAYDYDSDEYRNIPQECKGCIAVYNFPDNGWPAISDLSARYWDNVKDETPDPRNIIDLGGVNREEGPLYRDGTLEILNSNKEAATLSLNETNGTLYITGDTEIGLSGKGGKPNLTIELNGQTIFVASSSSDPQKALQIGDWCNINGPGVIIAVGDIYFAPKGDVGSNGQPVLILSVAGTTTLKPSGDFYGSIAGSVNVEAFSGETPTMNYPTDGFGPVNFPSIFEAYRTYSIYSYEVSQQ